MNYTEEILEQKAHVEQLRLEAEIKKWKLEVCKWQDAHSEMESAACALVESVYEKDAEIEKFHEFLHIYDLWVRGDICRRTLTEEREKLR